MFLIRRLFASLLWLFLSALAFIVGQWLERIVAGWLGSTFTWLFVNIKDLTWNSFWSAVGNYFSIFWSDITGIWLLDILIKILIGGSIAISLLFISALTGDREGSKFLKFIVGIPILLYVFAPPLSPYLIYFGAFYCLGRVKSNAYYIVGYPAELFFFIPSILLLSSAGNIFSYNNLADGNYPYPAWIKEDQASISNYFDFWIYIVRSSIGGYRIVDSFAQISTAVVNMIFSAVFVFAGYMITQSIADDEIKKLIRNSLIWAME